jgi:two-component system sensor kinase FixL
MSWLTATWLVIASACLTLAAVHLHVWIRQRQAWVNLAFAVFAVCVSWLGYLELRELHSDTPEEFGRYLWWVHFPVCIGMAGLVAFVRFYFRAGRAWLGWTAVGLRVAALVVNLFSTPNMNFREITSIEKVTVLGEPLAVVSGVPGPFLPIAHIAFVFLVAFVTDAVWTAWRKGDRRRLVVVAAALAVYVAAVSSVAIVSFWGVMRIPVFGIVLFVPVVFAMGYVLSADLIQAARLSAQLDARTVALRATEQRLAFAADAANAGLWSVEPDTGRLWATQRALQMFGLPEGKEHRIYDVLRSVHPEDQAIVRDFALNLKRLDSSEPIEYRVVDCSGNVRWYSARGGLHRQRQGTPKQMGATVDITERKRAEDDTARQRAELEHLSRVATLSELSGALAHELNQPLAIIMSNAQAAQRLLRNPVPDLDEIRAILDDIVEADGRAGEVITRLRGMLKRGAPNRQRLSVNRLVEDVLRFMRADLIRRGVVVELSLDPALPEIRADAVPVEQVLINIIGNACDAMAGNAPGDRVVKIRTAAEPDSVRVSIEDSGCGLPAEAEQVFAPFYTTKPEGLGMGLPISRSIVTAHGGKLVAHANPARGSKFILTLPVAAEAA